MKIIIFAKALAALTVLAMLAIYLSPTEGLREYAIAFAKFEGLAVAGAIVVAFAYPHLRGVEAGEKLLVKISDPLSNRMSISLATALESGKLNQKIKVNLGTTEALAVIESYMGIITPAWASVQPESALKVI